MLIHITLKKTSPTSRNGVFKKDFFDFTCYIPLPIYLPAISLYQSIYRLLNCGRDHSASFLPDTELLSTRIFLPTRIMATRVTKKNYPKKNNQGVGSLKIKLDALALDGAGPVTRSATTTKQTDTVQDAQEALQELLMQTDPPATTEQAELPDDKALLALRQKFKRTATDLTKVDSHRQFLTDCLQNDRIPKGLQVGTKCNALLSDYTDVQQKFKETTNRTQRELTSLLVDHYEQTFLRLSREKAEIQESGGARLKIVATGCNGSTPPGCNGRPLLDTRGIQVATIFSVVITCIQQRKKATSQEHLHTNW